MRVSTCEYWVYFMRGAASVRLVYEIIYGHIFCVYIYLYIDEQRESVTSGSGE